jgi:hypothetical protein
VLGRLWSCIYGGHFWLGWCAWRTFFFEVCGLDLPEFAKCVAFNEAQTSVGWWFAHKDFVMAADRPERLHLENGRLHSDDGMAIRYRDGWGLWYLSGVQVTEQIVMWPDTQTLAQIHGEKNEEVKRIRIERFGWPKYLEQCGAKVIHQRPNAVENTREALMRTSQGMTVLVCHCPSTARVYALEVDPAIETCEQAQNWLWTGSRLADGRRMNIIGRS